LITRQIASWRDFKFVSTITWPALTDVDIFNTPPCGKTIMVVVCSSKGCACGAEPAEILGTKEP
jgi:hypothetical protein